MPLRRSMNSVGVRALKRPLTTPCTPLPCCNARLKPAANSRSTSDRLCCCA
ncbi:Uncharacterised protein [Bordetella pertussis]|nr:Uncharacterised protein [Bordetella pertussis]CFW34324.1 Uncharacterised protein [Bordetella pertussis]